MTGVDNDAGLIEQEGSLLGALGVREGDALVSINGQRFQSGQEFVKLCRKNPNFDLQVVHLRQAPVTDKYRRVRCSLSGIECLTQRVATYLLEAGLLIYQTRRP